MQDFRHNSSDSADNGYTIEWIVTSSLQLEDVRFTSDHRTTFVTKMKWTVHTSMWETHGVTWPKRPHDLKQSHTGDQTTIILNAANVRGDIWTESVIYQYVICICFVVTIRLINMSILFTDYPLTLWNKQMIGRDILYSQYKQYRNYWKPTEWDIQDSKFSWFTKRVCLFFPVIASMWED